MKIQISKITTVDAYNLKIEGMIYTTLKFILVISLLQMFTIKNLGIYGRTCLKLKGAKLVKAWSLK